VQVVVGGDPGDGAEGRLATLPQQRPFSFVRGDPDGAGAVRATHLVDQRSRGVDAGRQTVDLDQEHGRGVTREPACTKSSTALGDLGVHHLQSGGDQAGGDDPRHGSGRRLDRGEVEQQVRTAGGSGVSRTAIRVAIPIVPSLPTNAPRRS
jgi:hypothetical protein